MRRYLKTILLLLLLFLNGCATLQDPTPSPAEIAQSQANTILECVISKDSDTLKSLLLPSMRESPETDRQVETFLNFIDGDVVSHSKPQGDLSSSEKRSGKIVWEFLSGRTANIKTTSGKKYTIYHQTINVSEKKPDDIGVYCITIVDDSTYKSERESPESARATIVKQLFSR